jgi:hypothetical protein
MGPPAQDSAPLLEGDVGFYGDGIGAYYWPVGSSLTLYFAALSISVNNNNKQQQQTTNNKQHPVNH